MTAATNRSITDSFRLVTDGGWVDALESLCATASPDLQSRWSQLLALCAEAHPRSGVAPATTAENDVESKCAYPPQEYLNDEPKPEPGSPGYQQALAHAAPDEKWFERVRDLTCSSDICSNLAKVIRRAMQSGIGSLNRNCANKEILRGLIWAATASPAPDCIDALRQLATWSVEHKTAQAKTVGIALASMQSELSAAALRMIAQAAKRPSPQTRFNRYASHVEARIGLNQQDSAERFIPTFELDAASRRRVDCGADGALELRIENSDASLHFVNSAGKVVSTVPAALKRNHAELVETLRDSAKALDKLLTTQRNRLESLLVSAPVWNFSPWRQRYLDHPVVGTLTRRLIWRVDDRAAICVDGIARDLQGGPIVCQPQSRVQLWHPIDATSDETLAWRNRLESLAVTQPFKQAHREIYVLTDAELQTRIYSNRFAAHVLNQSQFRALGAARGWERPFIGGWDHGSDDTAHRELPGGWRVDFWVSGIGNELDPTGAYLYIATDQVRFRRNGEPEPVPLDQVPSRIFSEAMRDVDLFVGVASVGNNPAWNDGGPEGHYRDYWQSYAFGELSASAKTRKSVLERLIPRLKIAAQCSFNEKFLVVRGQLRTYKIHLGSGNILMEPNDRYLCIVPDRSATAARPLQDVLLPFEGDSMLSVILSKVFLLADDLKIKDQSILNQIKAGL